MTAELFIAIDQAIEDRHPAVITIVERYDLYLPQVEHQLWFREMVAQIVKHRELLV